MRTRTIRILGAMIMASAVLWGLPESAQAVDGVVLIDQNRALAGNVTPGDAPGFPVTISRTGSYRLSGNLTVPDENTNAIFIAASNVTLDLNGFSILGPTVCSVPPPGSPPGSPTTCTPTGIGRGVVDVAVFGGSSDGTTLVNGTVQGMGDSGVVLFGNAHVENVHAVSNGASGIGVLSGTVVGSTALRNGRSGIGAGFGTVSGCTARDNTDVGISGDAITVSGNTVSGNFHGILVGANSVLIGNVATSNFVGLQLDSGSGYTHNVLSGNSAAAVTGTGTSLGQNLCNGVIC